MTKVLVYEGVGPRVDTPTTLVDTFRKATGYQYDVQPVTLEALSLAPWEPSTRMLVLGPTDLSDALWQTGAGRTVLATIHAWVQSGGVVAALGDATIRATLPLWEAGGACTDEPTSASSPPGGTNAAAGARSVRVGQGHVLWVPVPHPQPDELASWLPSVQIRCAAPDAHTYRLSPLYATAITAPLLETWLQRFVAPASRPGASPVWLHEAPTAYAVWESVPPASVLAAWDSDKALALVAVPPAEWTVVAPRMPHFHYEAYYDALSLGRVRSSALPWPSPQSFQMSVGNLVLYGDIVSSTQTVLESDRHLLRCSPPGTTVIATRQVRGRGRAHNAWLSPLGCLPFTTTVHLPLQIGNKAIFLQYLAALAIVFGLEAAYPAIQGRVRIKWPNDIYAQVPAAQHGSVCLSVDGQPRHFVKMGGILVTAVCEGDTFYAMVGCGVNCLNDEPTTSVQQLAADAGTSGVTIETCAGAILATLECLLRVWADHAYTFAPFVSAYRRAWLHSDQVVTLVEAPGQLRRIVGITSEHGLLRTVPVDATVRAAEDQAWLAASMPGAVDVQPDGNSFDLLAGCVRPK